MTDHQAFDLLALFKTLMMKIGDKKDINMFHGEIKIKISTFAKETHITLAI